MSAHLPAAVAGPVSVDVQRMAPLEVSSLFPLEPHKGVYERSRGEAEGRTYPYTVHREADDWVLEVDERHRLRLRVLEDGSIGLHRYESMRRDVSVDYSPTMLMLPGRLDDQVHEGEVLMHIHGLVGRTTMTGRVEYRISTVGQREVETPQGPRLAYIVIQEKAVRLPLVWANVKMETAYVPGLGRVLDHVHREHRLLGLIGDKVSETYRLAE